MNTARTVSDAKRTFYSIHTRPVNSIYRRVVEELLVEMHLLTVNVDYCYDPIYALGVVTAFDRFMQGYRPDRDLASIFAALCKSVEGDAQQFRQDAERMLTSIGGVTWDALLDLAESREAIRALRQATENARFKYSRLFAIGVYTILEKVDAEAVKDAEKLKAALEKLSTPLKLSADKLQKDLELYRSNLDKVVQAQAAMADMLEAERKRRDQREQEKAAKAAGAASETPAADSSTDS